MKQKYYNLLALFVFISILVVPLLSIGGGLGSDIDKYMNIANDFPNMKWSLFPIGLPLLLRFFNIFTHDYYWSMRSVQILSYVIILLFSYFKKFHFKETVILLSAKMFLHHFYGGAAETPFLFFMYFLFYYLYQFLVVNKGAKFSYLPASLIMIFLFMIRYSGLYIFMALAIFYLYYFVQNKGKIKFLTNDYAMFLIISFLGILDYALFNYYRFGDFMGETFRGPSDVKWFSKDFYMSVLGLFHTFNPVYFLRPENLTSFTFILHILMLIINIGFIYVIFKLYKKTLRKKGDEFYILIIFMGLFYMLLMFISEFQQSIVTLDVRLLCEASFCFFFAFIFLYYRKDLPEKYLYGIAVLSLFSNSLYFSRNPTSFLEVKKEVAQYYSSRENIKYFFNDTKGKYKTTVYKIPFVKKEIKYNHPTSEVGGAYAKIFVAKDPQILHIQEDTVTDKSKVVYTTQLLNNKK